MGSIHRNDKNRLRLNKQRRVSSHNRKTGPLPMMDVSFKSQKKKNEQSFTPCVLAYQSNVNVNKTDQQYLVSNRYLMKIFSFCAVADGTVRTAISSDGVRRMMRVVRLLTVQRMDSEERYFGRKIIERMCRLKPSPLFSS